MGYSIRQVVQLTGIPASTLRFYEAKGLLTPVRRNCNGVREYTDADLERLGSITCLKNTRMPIEEIRRFMELCGQGDGTLQKRREMVRAQQVALEKRIYELQQYKEHIDRKLRYYDIACASGSEAEAKRRYCCEKPRAKQDTVENKSIEIV